MPREQRDLEAAREVSAALFEKSEMERFAKAAASLSYLPGVKVEDAALGTSQGCRW